MNELKIFTDEVRTFLDENLTPDLRKAGRLEAGNLGRSIVASLAAAIGKRQTA